MSDNIINWFPGHMAKAQRLIKSNLSLVDIVIEIADARVASSSKNPQLPQLIGNKPHLLVLNKSDIADPSVTDGWIAKYNNTGILAVKCDCKSKSGVDAILPAIKKVLSDKLDRLASRGMVGRPIRVMVVGIPNAGKSSVINRLAKSKRAAVEDRPGVTRGKQWITIGENVELLDTPGVLWPKFEDQSAAQKLAFTGAVKDDVLDIEWLAVKLLEYLKMEYPKVLAERYHVEPQTESDAYELLEGIGRKRGMLLPGGAVNTERAAIMLVDEFRGGVLGRISLEKPL